MKNKKVVALLLAATMAVGCLAGCGQKETVSTETGSKATESQATESTQVEEPSLFNVGGQLPIVNEPITLKVLTQDQANHPMGHVQDSKFWDWLTEQTGIEFEVEVYTAEDLKTKLPLIMAGDDLPDIFLRCDFTYGDLESYANVGKIISMNDLMEEYGYYTKEIMEVRPDAASAFYAADGNCYGLPIVSAQNNAGRFNYGINQEWLDNLGLEVPTTLEELYDVLVAFKEKDANGNGDSNDEIPWSFTNAEMAAVNWMNSAVGFASYWPVTGAMFDEKDGEVFMIRTTDEYRYLLTFMNKCYEEGLIIPEAFTQSSGEQNVLKEANRVGVLGLVGAYDYTAKEAGKVLNYTGFVLGSEVSPNPVAGRGAAFNPNIFSISATTEYPEICFLLGDYLYSEEASWLSNYGKPGESLTWTDEANYQYVVEAGQKNDYRLFANGWLREEWTQQPENVSVKEYREKIDEYSKMAFQNYLVYTAEETEKISIYGTDLGTVLDEWYVHFITGEKDIETEWDDYVKLVESLNVKELTEVYQAAYDRFASGK